MRNRSTVPRTTSPMECLVTKPRNSDGLLSSLVFFALSDPDFRLVRCLLAAVLRAVVLLVVTLGLPAPGPRGVGECPRSEPRSDSCPTGAGRALPCRLGPNRTSKTTCSSASSPSWSTSWSTVTRLGSTVTRLGSPVGSPGRAPAPGRRTPSRFPPLAWLRSGVPHRTARHARRETPGTSRWTALRHRPWPPPAG